jgi:hypothetical protein
LWTITAALTSTKAVGAAAGSMEASGNPDRLRRENTNSPVTAVPA